MVLFMKFTEKIHNFIRKLLKFMAYKLSAEPRRKKKLNLKKFHKLNSQNFQSFRENEKKK